jgi:hypothetical protein
MSGHVFHPGHEELHGVTVVVAGASGRTYVGRYHERIPRGIVMHDVGIHDPEAAAEGRDAWIARQLKFGVRVDHRHLVVPTDEAGTITPLGEFQP